MLKIFTCLLSALFHIYYLFQSSFNMKNIRFGHAATSYRHPALIYKWSQALQQTFGGHAADLAKTREQLEALKSKHSSEVEKGQVGCSKNVGCAYHVPS